MINILDEIRKRSREEWELQAREAWTQLRIWVQEHGERAALVALGAGIFFVLLFKYVVFLFMVAVILAFAVWYLAVPASEIGKGTTGTVGTSATGVAPDNLRNGHPSDSNRSTSSTPSGDHGE